MSVRKLNTIQKREKLNNVYSIDDKGNGGANHKYVIVSNEKVNENDKYYDSEYLVETIIQFQNGARKTNDSVHGVIDTDLLEIVRDRLINFQRGEFACRENSKAISHIEEALMWLNRRVEDRIDRNVLGLNER